MEIVSDWRNKPWMVIGPDGNGLFCPLSSSSAGESHPMEAPYETFREIWLNVNLE